MRKPANLLFLAIVIAALGSTLVYRYLNSQQAQLDAARELAKKSMETVGVVVASRPIDVGTQIREGDVEILQWPADSEPTGALGSVSDAIDKIARTNIARFQPLAPEHLTDQRSGLLPLLIEQGKRAMSVRVDRETGVSGFITPNSYVDVLATGDVDNGGDGRERRAKLILQNVRVMAIGSSIDVQDNEPVEVPTVTLLVSPEEAEKLMLASQQKPVQLALRHFEDDDSVETPGQSMDELLTAHRVQADPAPVRVVHRQAAAPQGPSMEVLLGETMTRVSF